MPIELICSRGRWSSDCYKLYLRDFTDDTLRSTIALLDQLEEAWLVLLATQPVESGLAVAPTPPGVSCFAQGRSAAAPGTLSAHSALRPSPRGLVPEGVGVPGERRLKDSRLRDV
ncbi:hypothetical protein PGTUg99_013598 [Puccinia graminis f. sp. tritici]|uniref:Uncharacterized protein n=1 Tax=Puccinia graminis f. sp. tritici TaxID=56615 RepID=A0A5B0QHF0_PUCGR|nr:hypothetical protein PGTUg99_013598 [Puccinia graminis f. sp. tritici]